MRMKRFRILAGFVRSYSVYTAIIKFNILTCYEGEGGVEEVMMFALGKSIENGLKFTPENVRFMSCFDCDIN